MRERKRGKGELERRMDQLGSMPVSGSVPLLQVVQLFQVVLVNQHLPGNKQCVIDRVSLLASSAWILYILYKNYGKKICTWSFSFIASIIGR